MRSGLLNWFQHKSAEQLKFPGSAANAQDQTKRTALIAMAAVAVSILLHYGLADQLARVISKTGMIVRVRFSSFLLVCIGGQIMWNGTSDLLSSLHIQYSV